MSNNTQLRHKDHEVSSSKHPLHIVANNLNSPQNVGGLFRLCDAMGIEKLHLCGTTPVPPNAKIKKTSRCTEKYVAFTQHENAVELVTALKESGAYIISLEITDSSIALDSDIFKEKIRNRKLVCLILGSENTGVSEELLSLSDLTTHITMRGNNSSMNVISAASIACFEITREL